MIKEMTSPTPLSNKNSPHTSLQAEYRYRKAERGDLQLRFFPEAFQPGLRDKEERNTYRLGARHAFSPGSIILASLTHQDADLRQSSDQLAPPVTFFDFKRPEDVLSSELQYLFRSRYVNLISGAGYVYIDGRLDRTVGRIVAPRITFSTLSTDVQHTNFYTYSYINLLTNLTFTVGLSADLLNDDRQQVGDRDEFHPKFGMIWNPFPATTVRAAVFSVLKRTLIANQTLEPTQVAGFNQFFDDFNGTEAWRYGGAIDQKFTKDIFGGVEFSKRELKVPVLVAGNPVEPDMDEYLGRAYLFWTPHRWLALRAPYIFERLRSDIRSTGEPKELDTQRIPLGINFFHPSGLFTSLTATYFNQDFKFYLTSTSGRARSVRDDFRTVDAAVGYRLPKRYGFITVGATNLFDERFKFFDTNLFFSAEEIPFARSAIIQPERTFFARLTLAFP
jgi:hypothetical protein